MTEERKKYLDGISVEEKIIRECLKEQKSYIKMAKNSLKYANEYSVIFDKRFIAKRKRIIKALKKQLPAPKEYFSDEVCAYNGCSVCKGDIGEKYSLYCRCCGQKLR